MFNYSLFNHNIEWFYIKRETLWSFQSQPNDSVNLGTYLAQFMHELTKQYKNYVINSMV